MNSKVKNFLLAGLVLLTLLIAAIYILPRLILHDPAFELRMAADAGDTETVRDILSRFPETVNERQEGALSTSAVNQVNSSFMTDLKMRFSEGNKKSDRFLNAVLKTNSDLTGVHRGFVTCAFGMRDTSGATALDNAAIWGHTDIVKLLLENKANVTIKDRTGKTPLFWALGHTDVVEMLIQNGADVNLHDNNGETPLLSASLGKLTDTISLLLSNRADVNAANPNTRYTPLHWAVIVRHEPTVALLIQHGADVNAKDAWGRTPLTAIINSGSTNIIELLRSHGAKESDPSEVRKNIQMEERHDR